MTAPIPALAQMAAALSLGAGLGLLYDLLALPGTKHGWFRDLLFLAGAGYGQLYLTFSVCGGDLRIPVLISFAAGEILWGSLFRAPLGPVLQAVWKPVRSFFRFFRKKIKIILKKVYKFQKNLFSSWQK